MPSLKRIAGFHVNPDGTFGAVWMFRDPETDYVEVYDAALFEREVYPVVADAFIARGRFIPVAWNKADKATSDELLNRGVRMLPEGVDDSEEIAAVVSREIQGRMRAKMFKAKKELGNWFHEFNSFATTGGKVPREGFPLMSATRYAFSHRRSAKTNEKRKTKTHYQRAAII